MTRDELEKDMGRYVIIDGKIAPNPDLAREIERLAKIDSREVYANEEMFCDSDEWLERRSYEWVRDLMENETPNRRKEK